jgi:hypothetical protein
MLEYKNLFNVNAVTLTLNNNTNPFTFTLNNISCLMNTSSNDRPAQEMKMVLP